MNSPIQLNISVYGLLTDWFWNVDDLQRSAIKTNIDNLRADPTILRTLM